MHTAPETTERFSATNLGAVLSEQGRKQKWLAQQIGVSQHLISYVLAGRRTISREHAERIAAVLGVPFFVLFELHERSEYPALEKESRNGHGGADAN